MKAKAATEQAPGEGERAARRGYVHQDRASARLIYDAMINRSLRWVGLADRRAGIADDLVLGLGDVVVAHQFKRSLQPKPVGLKALLLGKSTTLNDLTIAYRLLRARYSSVPVRLRYLNNDYPTTNDQLIKGQRWATSAAFLAEREEHPRRSIEEWRKTRWKPVIDALVRKSRIPEVEFEPFWMSLDLVLGPGAAPVLDPDEDIGRRHQIEELARALSQLIADNPRRDEWSRSELLQAVGWPDRFALRFAHDFPVGVYVQRNEATEAKLAAAITAHDSGYISLVGPPGTGKSTLLQRELRERTRFHVVRYLAFMPGTAQGQGRGEADSFYDDVNGQLAATGLKVTRLQDDTTQARQQQFEQLLVQAGAKSVHDGSRYLIVVDGLDHIPREEHPDRSLLAALPLPQAVPGGVLFILGTQRLDLHDLPPSVQEQASHIGRRVDIASLSQAAVATMAEVLRLPAEIDRADLFRITAGHPLVTRYVIERLILAQPDERQAVLGGEFGLGGDLQAVYAAAWRSVEQVQDVAAVKQVLALIAHAQGRIEPELLAQATSDAAVEMALKGVSHLLDTSGGAWTAFHNSFRLFVQSKRVERFGRPDPNFAPAALYRTLADLASVAPATSQQRWLHFRYLYLAGEFESALAVADRSYFVTQYINGRSARAVRGDISDAYRAVKHYPDANKLFDLMLADDEVDRRAAVMASATSLIDAYLAAGDLDSASAALDDPYEEGKQWLVVDALLETGKAEAARQIFDAQSQLRSPTQGALRPVDEEREAFAAWVRRAVLFLDDDQLEGVSEGNTSEGTDGDAEQLVKGTRLQIASAIVKADPGADVHAIARRWVADPADLPKLLIEAAMAAQSQGAQPRVRMLLDQVPNCEGFASLHPSWPLYASWVAVQIGGTECATRLIASASLTGLGALDRAVRFEDVEPTCRALVTGVVVRTAIGLTLPELAAPKERLLKGTQHHLVALATAVGALRAGKPVGEVELRQLSSNTLRFLAAARTNPGENWIAANYVMPRVATVLGEVLFDLFALAGTCAAGPAALYDELVASTKTMFRWWPSFRRLVAVRTFHLDRDLNAALVRLEAGLADLDLTDPREEVEEKAQYAMAIAEIGAVGRARAILAELRRDAYGVYLAAKKDGQYEMWGDLLEKANTADPAGRRSRAGVTLRLLDGLEQTEGYSMGRRVARQMLFEAAVADAELAWSVARSAAATGAISWDGIVDAMLRGLVIRNPNLAEPALIAWTHLCLPWYDEPHGSIVSTGQFLRQLVAAVPAATVGAREAQATEAINILARPDLKLVLLRTLEEAARLRGFGERAYNAAARWDMESKGSAVVDPEQRSYLHFIALSDISDAIAEEFAYLDAHKSDSGQPHQGISYRLRRAAARAIKNSTWPIVASFAEAWPAVLSDSAVAFAAARVAVAAGHRAEAEALLRPFMNAGAEGWGGFIGADRLRYHEARHLLAQPDAHSAARADFIDDLVASRYGVSSVLWSIAGIFPNLFDPVPWPQLWDRLEAQLRGSRDYQRGQPFPILDGVHDDPTLLAELFCWAITLGVSLLHSQALRGAMALLDQGFTAIFIDIVERLLDRGGEAAAAGAGLLVQRADADGLVDHFGHRLEALADHADVAVASAALALADLWQRPVALEPRELPGFYRLHLPERDHPQGRSASDAHTRGMVIEDPMGWTAPWDDLVLRISEYADIPADQIRWRVRQLIVGWGGLERFGHSASKELERRLEHLGLKLPYRRPQAEASLRALRYVVAELWRAGRIRPQHFDILLHRLRVAPERPILPNAEARPVDELLPAIPRMMWGEQQTQWLDAVKEDLAVGVCRGAAVLGEWRVSTVGGIRRTATVERWRAMRGGNVPPQSIDAVVDGLPQVIWRGRLTPLYGPDAVHPSRVSRFVPKMLDSDPRFVLIFCPVTAMQLGWVSEPGSVHVYRDDEGRRMAWTQWWREGLPQPTGDDERCAEGQRVFLSDEGQHQLSASIGPVELTTWAWRWAEADERKGGRSCRFASDGS